MAGQMLLVNPKKKRKPAAKAAVRTIIKRVAVDAKAPAKRKRRAPTTITVKSNPKRRRARATAKTAGNLVKSAFMPAMVSSVGAVGLDVALGYAEKYIPDSMKSGTGYAVLQFAGAAALGVVVSKLKNEEMGRQVMIGGLALTGYKLMRQALTTSGVSLPLAGMNAYSDDGMGAYSMDGMGNMGVHSLGFYNPAINAGQMNGLGSFIDYN